MLRRLHIRDFVLVAELELELGAGFTVLTGETGAGKSILIDALKLALGERGDATVLHPGSSRAEISAEFDATPELTDWMHEQGFEPQDGVLLRRVIDAQGRSRGYINGSPATLTQLRAAGAMLVDIHGQHAWQSLARSGAARELLDAHAQAAEAAQACATAWRQWKNLSERLDAARSDAGRLQDEREQLAAQLAELARLAPQPQEWEPLNAEHHRLAHAAELIEHLQAAEQLLDDDETGTSRQLARAHQELHAAGQIDANLAGLIEQLESAQSLVQDLAHELAAKLRQTELDPRRLEEVDARLSAWLGLARRHRVPPEELPSLWQSLQAKLAELEQGIDLPALERQVEAADKTLRQAAAQLSALRAAVAPKLAQGVQQQMQSLGMKGGRFEIALQPLETIQAQGAEDVELLVAGHPGAVLRPMARVASGGELSRIALAVAATTSAQQPVGTLIFDEVDAGIGGAVAHTVGRLLATLGESRQVLAVTHLAQVAACAGGHLQVSKQSAGEATQSRMQRLDMPQRVGEIARMLGGDAASAVAQAHARELLQSASNPSQLQT
ncbi:recombination and repair protein [Thiomonas sp. X19]|uniref:DNA repair protein RecN n=1 Tax=Thiomonas sp. X19 TaxID=1050370 RepID=UPI000B6D007C|nr:DNA repair protein RecN [Thiomonas sp. X19]SCC92193.1 recombination and repair protein [Thiomonas sp. X19]